MTEPAQTLKCNVDLLRIIQLGLTFSDEEGNLHPRCTWQFHFFFDLKKDVFAQDSIELLRKVLFQVICPRESFRRFRQLKMQAGVDFEKHEKEGIDVELFGALMTVSGLTLTPEVCEHFLIWFYCGS